MWSLWMCRGKVSTATCCVYAKGAGKCRRTDLWCFMFYSAELVNSVNATWSTTLGLCLSYARMCSLCQCITLHLHTYEDCQAPNQYPSFAILCSTGPNLQMCSGSDAGECVCGQCRCRQEVIPQVSLSSHTGIHITPSTLKQLSIFNVNQWTTQSSSHWTWWLCLYFTNCQNEAALLGGVGVFGVVLL